MKTTKCTAVCHYRPGVLVQNLVMLGASNNYVLRVSNTFEYLLLCTRTCEPFLDYRSTAVVMYGDQKRLPVTADSVVGPTTGWQIARSSTEPGGRRGPGFVGEIVESWDGSRRHTARLIKVDTYGVCWPSHKS